MEIKAIVSEIGEDIVLQSEAGETIHLPKRSIPGVTVGQTIYISLADEPNRPAREVLNEILNGHDSPQSA